MTFLVRMLSIGWVGGIIFYGLRKNGRQVFGGLDTRIDLECQGMVVLLDKMFVAMPLERVRRYFYYYLGGLFAIGLILLAPSLGGGIFFGTVLVVGGFKLPARLLEMQIARRTTKFVVQMVDGLSLMSNSLRSGLNVPQALQLVTEELSNPIAQEFNLVLSQNKLGISLEEALSNLSVRMPHDDIEMFTTSVNILKETGGNLAETFETISFTIRERIKIESKIQAMTAQGVMQGVIVILMPFGLGAALYVIDPERISPMFTTPLGWMLLSGMMTLQALGGFMIWKIVQIKV